jgi:hypothetical protein
MPSKLISIDDLVNKCQLDGLLDPADDFVYALNCICLQSSSGKRVSPVWLTAGLQRKDVQDALVASRVWVFMSERLYLKKLLAEVGLTIEFRGRLPEQLGGRGGVISYVGPIKGRKHGKKHT